MTLEQARVILKTYTMPMTTQQLAEYKQALALVAGSFARSDL